MEENGPKTKRPPRPEKRRRVVGSKQRVNKCMGLVGRMETVAPEKTRPTNPICEARREQRRINHGMMS